jgi:hypothetical protein
MDSYDVSG